MMVLLIILNTLRGKIIAGREITAKEVYRYCKKWLQQMLIRLDEFDERLKKLEEQE